MEVTATSRGRGGGGGRRRREGGLVDDGGDLEGAFFAFAAAAFPVLVCFLGLAVLFFVVFFFVSFVSADEDLPRRVAGAFLLLLFLLGLFETDAIGGIDVDADVFFFFETVAVFAFAPSDALTDERVLRVIEGDGAEEKRGLKSKRN